ncbi:MAG: hypothetical protein OXE99_02805 [Cellvibrionales bacterium]|nr:hypothetical protein [Cellvibrionales bacterium]
MNHKHEPWLKSAIETLENSSEHLEKSVCDDLLKARLNALKELNTKPRHQASANKKTLISRGMQKCNLPLSAPQMVTTAIVICIGLFTAFYQNANFNFRESVITASMNAEYLEWEKDEVGLDNLDEDQLGLLAELEFYSWIEANEMLAVANDLEVQDG